MKNKQIILATAAISLVLMSLVGWAGKIQNSEPGKCKEKQPVTRKEMVEAFQDWHFGIMVHWGLSAGHTDSHGLTAEQIADKAGHFDQIASDFDAAQWVRTFKEAGAGYLVMTPSHNADRYFCLFKTKTTDFHSKRDYIGEISAECHRQDLPLFMYLSLHEGYHNLKLREWTRQGCPNRKEYMDRIQKQVSDVMVELASQYDVTGIWLDGWPVFSRYLSKAGFDLFEMYDFDQMVHGVRQVNPAILIGNKCPIGYFRPYMDYIGQAFGGSYSYDVPFEEYPCNLPGSHWFARHKEQVDFMTAEQIEKQIIYNIQEMICAVGRGCNYVVNTGPLPNGQLQRLEVEILKGIGRWFKRNGQAVYGTRFGPLERADWGYNLIKGDRIYLHIIDNRSVYKIRPRGKMWPKTGVPDSRKIIAENLPGPVRAVYLLNSDTLNSDMPIPYKIDGRTITLDLSDVKTDPIDTIVVLDM